ncbi:MAG: Two-component hybrid sensor and regulator [Acidobacteriales bacterium]|nr:Two-component hybrid sensor and regulator [Terriglobales bacterium]
MYQLSVRTKGALIVAISITFKIVLLFGLLFLQYQNQRAEEASTHSKQILSVARQLMSELLNAETGMRGYIISGNPVFLEPYNDAVRNVLPTQQKLEKLCGDSSVLLPLARAIKPSAEDLLTYHGHNKALIEAGSLQAVREATRQGEGKRRMDKLRGELQQIVFATGRY